MLPPSTTDVSARLKAEKVKYLRHDVQAEYQKQFEESLVREKELVSSEKSENREAISKSKLFNDLTVGNYK